MSCWDLTSARSLGPMRERHLCKSSTVGASTSRCMPGTSLCHGPACASMLSSRMCCADELGIKAAAFMHQLPSCVLAERQDTECKYEGRNQRYALMSLKRQVELTVEVQPLRGSQCSMGSILVTLAPATVSPEATAVAVARRVVVHSAIDSGCIWVLFFTCCPFCWPHAKAPIFHVLPSYTILGVRRYWRTITYDPDVITALLGLSMQPYYVSRCIPYRAEDRGYLGMKHARNSSQNILTSHKRSISRCRARAKRSRDE